jgi:hypothetical protein
VLPITLLVGFAGSVSEEDVLLAHRADPVLVEEPGWIERDVIG